jgi:hypothetical protein
LNNTVIFRAINFGMPALSREMEFNADLVAVSVTGSDALIHGLARVQFAEEAANQAARDLFAAAHHGLFTRDVFYHHRQAASFLRDFHKSPKLGLPPELPADPKTIVAVFLADETVPDAWSSHPSHHQREQNAKKCYVRSPHDDRSPWMLFRNADSLREQVTRCFYHEMLKRSVTQELSDSEQVQAFIDDEHREVVFDPKYHGQYDDRFIDLGNLDNLVQEILDRPWSHDRLARVLAETYPAEPPSWMSEYFQHISESDRLHSLYQLNNEGEQNAAQEFEFRGTMYPMAQLPRFISLVKQELTEEGRRFASLDRQVFQIHFRIARQAGNARDQELLDRYRAQLEIQGILNDLTSQRDQIEGLIGVLSHYRLSRDDTWSVLAAINEAHSAFATSLRKADQVQLLPLKTLPAGGSLRALLLGGISEVSPHPGGRKINRKWLDAFCTQLAAVRERAHRFHFKNLGGILALQSELQVSGTKRELDILPLAWIILLD